MKEAFEKRKTPRLSGFDYNTKGAYFITVCTMERRCLLSKITVGTGVLDCPQDKTYHSTLFEKGKIAERVLRQMDAFYENISVDAFVIMPNHIHILLFVREGGGQSGTPVPTTREERANSTYSRFVSTFKRFCNKEYGENIWQSRSYDHIIRDREDYDEHIRYIYENPMRGYFDELYSEN